MKQGEVREADCRKWPTIDRIRCCSRSREKSSATAAAAATERGGADVEIRVRARVPPGISKSEPQAALSEWYTWQSASYYSPLWAQDSEILFYDFMDFTSCSRACFALIMSCAIVGIFIGIPDFHLITFNYPFLVLFYLYDKLFMNQHCHW